MRFLIISFLFIIPFGLFAKGKVEAIGKKESKEIEVAPGGIVETAVPNDPTQPIEGTGEPDRMPVPKPLPPPATIDLPDNPDSSLPVKPGTEKGAEDDSQNTSVPVKPAAVDSENATNNQADTEQQPQEPATSTDSQPLPPPPARIIVPGEQIVPPDNTIINRSRARTIKKRSGE